MGEPQQPQQPHAANQTQPHRAEAEGRSSEKEFSEALSAVLGSLTLRGTCSRLSDFLSGMLEPDEGSGEHSSCTHHSHLSSSSSSSSSSSDSDDTGMKYGAVEEEDNEDGICGALLSIE